MTHADNRTRHARWAIALTAVAGAAFIAAACGGTSGADKTKTAVAKGGGTVVATRAAVTPAAGSATAARTSAATAAATTAPVATPGTAGSGGSIKVGDTSLGKVLTDDKGFTLYTFKNDVVDSGKSVCNGACATLWPPARATSAPTGVTGASGVFALITRDDGSNQVAYNGRPLYRYAPDSAAGDTKGDGIGGVWSAAKP